MTTTAAAPIDPGPYCNEDGDWWVPVEAIPNRMKAHHAVRMVVDSDAKVRYVGLSRACWFDMEHEDVCSEDDDGNRPPCVILADAWHFEEVWP